MYEIERRFLVPSLPKGLSAPQQIEQFYLANLDGMAIRVRFVNGQFSFITFKRNIKKGINFEFEYEVTDEQQNSILPWLREQQKNEAIPGVTKFRHTLPFKDELSWEIDVITINGTTVNIAEIEVPTLEHDLGELPPWIGEEVTGLRVWSNASIAKFGFPKV